MGLLLADNNCVTEQRCYWGAKKYTAPLYTLNKSVKQQKTQSEDRAKNYTKTSTQEWGWWAGRGWWTARAQDALMAVAVLLLLSGYSFSAMAVSERGAAGEMTLDQVESGRLLWKASGADSSTSSIVRYKPATLLEEEVAIRVSGLILTATLKQRFKNDTAEWLEAVYAFPLPENAALYKMDMQIGERRIKGVVKEKQQAKKIYQQAKKTGKKAALVEQHRPNLFTNHVANIPPGETIEISLEYNQVVRYDQGEFELRFPLTTTPRYFPGEITSETGRKALMPADVAESVAEQIRQRNAGTAIDGSIDAATGWALPTTAVPDAHLISPFTIPLKSVPENTHRVRLSATIDAGFPVESFNSSSHKITTQSQRPDDSKGATGAERYQVMLEEGQSAMERDFVLTWRPQIGSTPKAALFTETLQDELYSLLMVMPPQQLPEEMLLPREQIFVIDTSGSMGGESIRQAKASLEKALLNLRATDRFNVIEFNSATHTLFNSSVPADPQKISAALSYVRRLRADGGTEMSSALTAGFSGSVYPGYLRQVIFITDGSVGNERALFDQIQQQLGDSRLFTIGIGSAPNSYFMRKAAVFGRGTFTYIGDLKEVESKLARLFDKLRAPVLSDLAVSLTSAANEEAPSKHGESYPSRVNDLYLGEPVVQVIKHDKAASAINVTASSIGMYQSHTPLWEQSFELNGARQADGIATYWGRQKIESLMDSASSGSDSATKAALREKVIEVALKHHLVSPYTSLVAVEEVISRPVDSALKSDAVPQLLPKGSTQKMARLPQTATSSQWYLLVGFLCYMLGIGLIYQQRSGAPFSKRLPQRKEVALSTLEVSQ
ncbi:marine proteobacterial sortase target protein [Alkalimarinus coralli]|uniref:marine proteobacterial sortase target protein n=1 Tax=Alkalimarinus coralli TaxID=2935863 RepID=UPI00202B07DB|nr:marine proteobacterial sortase target protein [Alkalimarinus coralli]